MVAISSLSVWMTMRTLLPLRNWTSTPPVASGTAGNLVPALLAGSPFFESSFAGSWPGSATTSRPASSTEARRRRFMRFSQEKGRENDRYVKLRASLFLGPTRSVGPRRLLLLRTRRRRHIEALRCFAEAHRHLADLPNQHSRHESLGLHALGLALHLHALHEIDDRL